MRIAKTMCTPCTVALIFFDERTLHIKRLIGKFKQQTNVPYPYHHKKGVPHFSQFLKRTVPVPLQKRRTVLQFNF